MVHFPPIHQLLRMVQFFTTNDNLKGPILRKTHCFLAICFLGIYGGFFVFLLIINHASHVFKHIIHVGSNVLKSVFFFWVSVNTAIGFGCALKRMRLSQRTGVATANSELCCVFAVWKPPDPDMPRDVIVLHTITHNYTADIAYLVASVVAVSPLCMLVSRYFSALAIPVRTQESWKHDAPGFLFSAGSHGTTRLRQWWGR